MATRMNRRLAIPLLLALAGGCASAGATGPVQEGTVRAIRYRQLIVEGALEFSHGGGQWQDALYLPDSGVVCNLSWKTDLSGDGTIVGTPRLYAYAFPGTLDDQLACRPQDDPEGRTPPEEIRIPAELARAILDLAERTREQRELSALLGRRAVEAKAVGGQETVHGRNPFR